jgi:hypothetical protein
MAPEDDDGEDGNHGHGGEHDLLFLLHRFFLFSSCFLPVFFRFSSGTPAPYSQPGLSTVGSA